MANRIKDRAERNGKIRRTVSKIEQTIAKLERLKDEYLEKAGEAKARGDAASYSLCKSALNTTLSQIKRSKEMLLNIEITAELQKMGETNADFLTAMSTVAKRIGKINRQSDFVKLQKEIQKALCGMEEAQAGLDVFLNSADAHFATISQTQGALTDRQIEELLSGRITERELLMDARIAAASADSDGAGNAESKIAELDGDEPQISGRAMAKPFPSPRGMFEFSPKASPEISFDIFGDDGELPLKSVARVEETPTLVIGKTADGDVKRVSLAESPITLVSGTAVENGAFLNSAICSLVASLSAEKLRLVLFDFCCKELCVYDGMAHMAADAITSVGEALPALGAISAEIDRRFEIMNAVGKKNIGGYNVSAAEKLPYIVVAIDGYSDAMAVSGFERELLKLLRVASDAGVYFILAKHAPRGETAAPGLSALARSEIVFKTPSESTVGAFELEYIDGSGSKTACLAPYISSDGVARVARALGENVL